MNGPPVGAAFKTSDGYELTRQENGDWSDGDLTFGFLILDGMPCDDGGEALEGELLNPLSSPVPTLENFVDELRRVTEEFSLPVSTSRVGLFETPNLDGLSIAPEDYVDAGRVLLLLAEYAFLKAQAMRQRLAGDINEASRLEGNCDKMYAYELPQWARW